MKCFKIDLIMPVIRARYCIEASLRNLRKQRCKLEKEKRD